MVGLQLGPQIMWGQENNESGTAYEDSSDLCESFNEIGSDGEVKTFKSRYIRFKDKGGESKFTLDMKFDGKEGIRRVIIIYGLHHKRLVRFPKMTRPELHY